MASKWTLAQYEDGWPDQVFQDISPDTVEYGVSVGTTFTPLLPLTPERVAALRTFVNLHAVDDESAARAVVRAMLAEMEGAHDEIE